MFLAANHYCLLLLPSLVPESFFVASFESAARSPADARPGTRQDGPDRRD